MPDCPWLDCAIDETNASTYKRYHCMGPEDNFGAVRQNCCALGGIPLQNSIFYGNSTLMGMNWYGFRRAASHPSWESRKADGTIGVLDAGRARRVTPNSRWLIAPSFFVYSPDNVDLSEGYRSDAWCSTFFHPCERDGDATTPIGSVWTTCYVSYGIGWQLRTQGRFRTADQSRLLLCQGCDYDPNAAQRGYIMNAVPEKAFNMGTLRTIADELKDLQAFGGGISNTLIYAWGKAEQGNNVADPNYTQNQNCVASVFFENNRGGWFILNGRWQLGSYLTCTYDLSMQISNELKHAMQDRRGNFMRNLVLDWLFNDNQFPGGGEDDKPNQISSTRRSANPFQNPNADIDQFGQEWNSGLGEPWDQLPVVWRGTAYLRNRPDVTFEYEYVIAHWKVWCSLAIHRIRNQPHNARNLKNIQRLAVYPACRVICNANMGVRIPDFPTDLITADGEPISLRPSDYDIHVPQVRPFTADQIVFLDPYGDPLNSVPPTWINFQCDIGPHSNRDSRTSYPNTLDGERVPGRGWRNIWYSGGPNDECNVTQQFWDFRGGLWVAAEPSHSGDYEDPDDSVIWGGAVNLQMDNWRLYCIENVN